MGEPRGYWGPAFFSHLIAIIMPGILYFILRVAFDDYGAPVYDAAYWSAWVVLITALMGKADILPPDFCAPLLITMSCFCAVLTFDLLLGEKPVPYSDEATKAAIKVIIYAVSGLVGLLIGFLFAINNARRYNKGVFAAAFLGLPQIALIVLAIVWRG